MVRRLPLPPTSIESRRISRPLPKVPPLRVPSGYVCKNCGTCITSKNVAFPSSSVSSPRVLGRFMCLIVLVARYPQAHEGSRDFLAKHAFSKKRECGVYLPIQLPLTRFIRYNVHLAKSNVQLMTTGAHTMQEMSCAGCQSYIGWKIVRAHEKSESWKDGQFLLELEMLHLESETTNPSNTSPWPSSGSDSEYSP